MPENKRVLEMTENAVYRTLPHTWDRGGKRRLPGEA